MALQTFWKPDVLDVFATFEMDEGRSMDYTRLSRVVSMKSVCFCSEKSKSEKSKNLKKDSKSPQKLESRKVELFLTFLVFLKHPLPGKSHALRRERHMEPRWARGACNGQGLTSAPFLPDHPGLQGTE